MTKPIKQNKTSFDELKIKQAWPLWKKIEHAKKRLLEFYDFTDGRMYPSFSGGLDSTVGLHITRSIFPEMMGVFCNTTIEYPELIKFVKKNTKHTLGTS